jgi:hypothetical protein
MSVIIKGGTGGVLAEVDANKNLYVNTPTTVGQVGHIAVAAEADPGTIAVNATTAIGRQIRDCDISQDYRLRVGTDTPLFCDNMQGSVINLQLWTFPTSTATLTVGSGVVSFGSSTTSSAHARMSTWRTFPFYQAATTYYESRILIMALNTNTVCDFGFGICATNAEVLDGAYFKYDAAGAFKCIINFNGTLTTASPGTMPTINQYHHYVIGVSQDYVEFWVDNVLYAQIPTPVTQPTPTSAAALPIFHRVYNTAGAVGTATTMKFAEAMVSLGELQTNKPWTHIQAGSGLNCFQTPTNIASATTQNIVNSTIPAAIAGSNTTCTYAATLLSGDFRLNAAATAETDYIIYAYLNVAGTAAITGRTLYITGCRISTIVFGAAVATTCTTLAWYLGFNQTAITMATTDGTGTTKAARRIGLGHQFFPQTTAIVGYPANMDIDTQFATPYVCAPGEYVHILCRQLVGTATGSCVFRGSIILNGYWE